jgi:hypothetical protein
MGKVHRLSKPSRETTYSIALRFTENLSLNYDIRSLFCSSLFASISSPVNHSLHFQTSQSGSSYLLVFSIFSKLSWPPLFLEQYFKYVTWKMRFSFQKLQGCSAIASAVKASINCTFTHITFNFV